MISGLLDMVIEEVLLPLLKSVNLEILRIPSNAAIITGLLVFYDRVLWKLPVFNLLVRVPNMNGRYKGKIRYTFNKQQQSKNCIIEIHQTASKIHLISFFNNENAQKTESKSFIETIEKEGDGNYAIYVFYSNGGTKIDGVLDTHEGVNNLRYLPKTKDTPSKLTGYYFTNRQKQTRGEIDVEFESIVRKGEF